MLSKKEFLKSCSYHKYTNSVPYNGIRAVFGDYQVVRDENGEEDELFGKPVIGRGYKFCFWCREKLATRHDIETALYKYATGKIDIDDVSWFIQTVVAQNDKQRFKVPLGGSDLNKLIDYNLK